MRYGTLLVSLFALAGLMTGCARQHPPPGSQYAMAEVLLRHELAVPHSPLGLRGARCPCYVLVGEQDLPRERSAALADTGVTFLPGSDWSPSKGPLVRIGLPRTRWNGNFDVAVLYDCGPRCEESISSIVRYDGSRWRVIRP